MPLVAASPGPQFTDQISRQVPPQPRGISVHRQKFMAPKAVARKHLTKELPLLPEPLRCGPIVPTLERLKVQPATHVPLRHHSQMRMDAMFVTLDHRRRLDESFP